MLISDGSEVSFTCGSIERWEYNPPFVRFGRSPAKRYVLASRLPQNVIKRPQQPGPKNGRMFCCGEVAKPFHDEMERARNVPGELGAVLRRGQRNHRRRKASRSAYGPRRSAGRPGRRRIRRYRNARFAVINRPAHPVYRSSLPHGDGASGLVGLISPRVKALL